MSESFSTGSVVVSSIQVRGDTLAFKRVGRGEALVIIHGIGGHKEDWDHVALALSPSFTVYAVDMLGFGASSRNTSNLDMDSQSEAIKALLDDEGVTNLRLLGNSVGGWVAATFASIYPEMTEKLILADPAGFKAMFEGNPPVNLFPDNASEMRELLRYVRYQDSAQTEEAARAAFAQFQSSDEKSIVPRLFPAMAASPKLEEILPKVQAPSLVIWGEDDRLFPVTLAPYITGLLDDAKSVIIPKASHFAQLDNPSAYVDAVSDFLA